MILRRKLWYKNFKNWTFFNKDFKYLKFNYNNNMKCYYNLKNFSFSSSLFKKSGVYLIFWKNVVSSFYLKKNYKNTFNATFLLLKFQKIFFHKGFWTKIFLSINSVFLSILDIYFFFFKKNFFNYFYISEEKNNKTTFFVFNDLNFFLKDFFFNELKEGNLKNVSLLLENQSNLSFINYDNLLSSFFNDEDYIDDSLPNNSKPTINEDVDFSPINTEDFIINLVFKFYSTFFISNKIFFNFNNKYNFFFSKNVKFYSITFLNKYFQIYVTYLKKHSLNHNLQLLNNFLYKADIIPRFLTLMPFFFKTFFKSLNKKMRKILKNKRRYEIIYSYIKPKDRHKVMIHFLKKNVLITDGQNFKSKFFNVFLSLALEKEKSWIYSIYTESQLAAVKSLCKKE